jgi:ATP-binding cassette subfamily F protein uup
VPAKKSAPAPAADSGAKARTKLSYKDQRDLDLLPREIEKIEGQIARDEAAMADPDLYTKNPTRFAALMKAVEEARAKKDAAEHRWLELAEMAEGLA